MDRNTSRHAARGTIRKGLFENATSYGSDVHCRMPIPRTRQELTEQLNVSFDYQGFSAEDGIDTIFLAEGTTVRTRLNEVNWRSSALGLGIIYRF